MGFNLTPMVQTLLILNVGIFILQNMGLPFFEYLPLYPVQSDRFIPFQFLTYMFLHSTQGIGHIFGNMFGLFIFGPMLERFWGSGRFLFFYLFTGIGAGLLHSAITYYELYQLQEATQAYLASPDPSAFVQYLNEHASTIYSANYEFINSFQENPDNPQIIQETRRFVSNYFNQRANIPTVGASGAIFGILMAFGLLFPNTEIYLYFLFPIKAKYLVAFYGLYELYAGFQRAPGDSIAHFAHIGGMLFAYILIRYWGSQRHRFY
jgi:membrane associated rhomboid family serine protease